MDNKCDMAIQSPNRLLYCDRATSGAATRFRGRRRSRWRGRIRCRSAAWSSTRSFQGLPGYAVGATTYAVRGADVFTRPARAIRRGLVASTTGRSWRRQRSKSLGGRSSSGRDEHDPRNNELDFGIAKRLKFGRIRIDPKVDMFNALNSDDYYSVTSTAFSPILNTVSGGESRRLRRRSNDERLHDVSPAVTVPAGPDLRLGCEPLPGSGSRSRLEQRVTSKIGHWGGPSGPPFFFYISLSIQMFRARSWSTLQFPGGCTTSHTSQRHCQSMPIRHTAFCATRVTCLSLNRHRCRLANRWSGAASSRIPRDRKRLG